MNIKCTICGQEYEPWEGFKCGDSCDCGKSGLVCNSMIAMTEKLIKAQDEIQRLQCEVDAYELAEAERNAGIIGECPQCVELRIENEKGRVDVMGSRNVGLYEKYHVERTDGKPMPDGCIVLEWRDRNARMAIAAFAEVVGLDGYNLLSDDLIARLRAYGHDADVEYYLDATKPARDVLERAIERLRAEKDAEINRLQCEVDAYELAESERNAGIV